MFVFEKKREVRHSADDIFLLVANIEKYPDFLPLCQNLIIRSQYSKEKKTFLVADMSVGFCGCEQTFQSEIVLDQASRIIEVYSSQKPFNNLFNRWTFEPLPSGCRITFFITYGFKNRITEMLVGHIFDRYFSFFVEAFEQKADDLFTPKL